MDILQIVSAVERNVSVCTNNETGNVVIIAQTITSMLHIAWPILHQLCSTGPLRNSPKSPSIRPNPKLCYIIQIHIYHLALFYTYQVSCAIGLL